MDWRSVVFSDDSRFCFGASDCRLLWVARHSPVFSPPSPSLSRPPLDCEAKCARLCHNFEEIIEVDPHVNSRSITQELKIDHKTVLSHSSKVGLKRKLHVWVPHKLTPKSTMDRISIFEALAKQNEIDPFHKRMGLTLNSDICCQQLNRLKLVIDQKWPELPNSRGVVFHHDNARHHTSIVTR
ncbi:histonelysine Nmethyltransferase SETMARlike [Trichonephila clavipes]|nr:histonelysine Nmethyltransferase SETMARlike [Trichonephila clavipes]